MPNRHIWVWYRLHDGGEIDLVALPVLPPAPLVTLSDDDWCDDWGDDRDANGDQGDANDEHAGDDYGDW